MNNSTRSATAAHNIHYEHALDELTVQYNKVIKELKHEKRKVRKINREKYNIAREEAATCTAVQRVRNKLTKQLEDQNLFISHIKDEYKDMKEERNAIYRKYLGCWLTLAGTFILMWFQPDCPC